MNTTIFARRRSAVATAATIVAIWIAGSCSPAVAAAAATVQDFPIAYPSACPQTSAGSTHEISSDDNRGALWVSGQSYDSVVRVALDGSTRVYRLPACSGPHGIELDKRGRLWVTLESKDQIVRLGPNGRIETGYGVHGHPHGLTFGSDGTTIWYTGKANGTVGKIAHGVVQTFNLHADSTPIYVKAGNDGNIWVTELVGNAIARVSPSGGVREFPIPTAGSRPIAIVAQPGGKGVMWFTEEAGNKIGRIAADGSITEFAVPKQQPNVILAGLAFDREGNLWVQQYIDRSRPDPPGPDHIIKIDKAILSAGPSAVAHVSMTCYDVPTRSTVMHRIVLGPDGNMWFTELHADKVGKVQDGDGSGRGRPCR